ncbi:MAG TPA: hypothetical protein VGJ73_08755, partial [Verrucomicrobiae bacterium]
CLAFCSLGRLPQAGMRRAVGAEESQLDSTLLIPFIRFGAGCAGVEAAAQRFDETDGRDKLHRVDLGHLIVLRKSQSGLTSAATRIRAERSAFCFSKNLRIMRTFPGLVEA